MQKRYGGKAGFLTIYIKEDHPTDEWQMKVNEKEDICYPQPRTLEDRLVIARDFVARHQFEIPLLVDAMDDRADEVWAGWPERLYIVGEDGKIAYKGETGPFGFHPEEVESWLASRFPD
jgi:hypothetical protein